MSAKDSSRVDCSIPPRSWTFQCHAPRIDLHRPFRSGVVPRDEHVEPFVAQTAVGHVLRRERIERLDDPGRGKPPLDHLAGRRVGADRRTGRDALSEVDGVRDVHDDLPGKRPLPGQRDGVLGPVPPDAEEERISECACLRERTGAGTGSVLAEPCLDLRFGDVPGSHHHLVPERHKSRAEGPTDFTAAEDTDLHDTPF